MSDAYVAGHAILPDDRVESQVLQTYALGANCAVIGSYKGATMRYLLDHGARSVVGVEPQRWARDRAVASLLARGPAAWEIDCVALVPWATNPVSTVRMYDIGTDAASFKPRERGPGVVSDTDDVDALNVDEWLNGKTYDFMVMNCEGSEYLLLPWLVAHATVLLVQYHGAPIPMSQIARLADWDHVANIGKGWFLYT